MDKRDAPSHKGITIWGIILLVFYIITWGYVLLILETQEWGGGARERETSIWERNINWLPPRRPDQGWNPQPRYVPWPRIELPTFWCTGWCSNQLSHPAEPPSQAEAPSFFCKGQAVVNGGRPQTSMWLTWKIISLQNGRIGAMSRYVTHDHLRNKSP